MKDLRDFISECEKKLPKEFVKVTKEVDSEYEISAIIKKLDLMGKHPLVFFKKVKGMTSPMFFHILPLIFMNAFRNRKTYLI
jgi:UbiD family decarboxylase